MRRTHAPPPLLLLAFGLAGVTACQRSTPAGRPLVAVSVAPQAELVERLAGGAVDVVTMIPAGTDVETYAPGARQLAALSAARIYFKVGHPALALERAYLEPWLARHPGVRQVSLAAHVDLLLDLEPAGGAASGDPHLWMSVRGMRGAAAELAAALADLLPADAALLRERARRLDAELGRLDAALGERFRASAGRRFLVYHPALGYLAHDYGLVQEAIEAGGKEPSPARLAARIESSRRAGVRVVLGQRGLPPKSAAILATALGAEVVEVDPMAADWLANVQRIADAVAGALVDD